MSDAITRRTFHAAAGAAALGMTALQARSVLGANDRVRLGCIGVANRGGQVMRAFLKHPDVEIGALCDVDKTILEKASAMVEGRAQTYGDFRKLIERKDLDAVLVATPDHWHAIQTIAACKSGKDVYCEKPLSVTIREGRRMVEVARQTERIVQVGTHRRSSRLHAQLAELIAAGTIGKVCVARAYRLSNMAPTGIGRAQAANPPAELDWDMWLGPRPERPYQENIHPYKFRWWQLYSSQMANWGVHRLDAIRWFTGELAPASICAMGGRYVVDDDRTIPDTMEVTFEFASGRLAVFGVYESSGNPAIHRGEVECRGTLGSAYIDTKALEIIPERGGQFQDRQARMEPMEVKATDADLTVQHTRNFLDCVKSRSLPNADVEIGHRSTTFSLLANMSLALRARLEWDAEKEVVTNLPEANELLHYEYRKPWVLG